MKPIQPVVTAPAAPLGPYAPTTQTAQPDFFGGEFFFAPAKWQTLMSGVGALQNQPEEAKDGIEKLPFKLESDSVERIGHPYVPKYAAMQEQPVTRKTVTVINPATGLREGKEFVNRQFWGSITVGPPDHSSLVNIRLDVVGEGKERRSTLLVDGNGNGDFADDPATIFEHVADDKDSGKFVVRSHDQDYQMSVYWFPDRQPERLNYFADYAMTRVFLPQGEDGKKIPVYLYDRSAKADWTFPRPPLTADDLIYAQDELKETVAKMREAMKTKTFDEAVAAAKDDLKDKPDMPELLQQYLNRTRLNNGLFMLVDEDGNGEIEIGEQLYSSEPLNLGGKSYTLKSVSPDGSNVEFEVGKAEAPKEEALLPKAEQKAPVLTGKCISGPGKDTDIDLAKSFPRKIVLIDFWATWCGPCRGEYPHLVKLREKFGTEHFEILSVSRDSLEDLEKRDGARPAYANMTGLEILQKKIVELHSPWVHVRDGDSEIAKNWRVVGIPEYFLVDGDTGEILEAGSKLRGDFDGLIEKHLTEKKSALEKK